MTALLNNYSLYSQTQPPVNSVPVNFQEIQSFSGDNSIVLSTEINNGINCHIFRLLDQYATLGENWDEEGADEISRNVISKARYITLIMQKSGQLIYHSAPGPNGEVMLDIRNIKRSRSIEIIIYTNRTVLVEFPEKGRPKQMDFDIEQLRRSLDWLNSNS